MLVDSKTLADLEIFWTRDGGPGVFQTLNRTRTPGGSDALRERFENPVSDPALLQQVQAGVRFLLQENITFDVQPELIRRARSYLDSAWDVGSRARGLRFFLEAAIVSVRYRDLLQHAREGVATVRRLLSELIPFLERILDADPPSEARRPVENLLALTGRLELERLPPSGRPWRVFRADRYLRVERKADFQRFFRLLSELDALIAMAEVVRERDLVLPELVEEEGFVMEGEDVFHPFLSQPVQNPLALAGGETVLFLTGPNMAGKTTYLKAAAVSAFLAHVGMGVPARSLRISVLDGLFSSMGPEESLREGLSQFMAEVRRVREIAGVVAEGRRILAVFDEVFRGTNPADALDASRMVVLGFAGGEKSGFIFSSHLVDLAEDLRGADGVRLARFEGEIQSGHVRYGFRLRDGVSDQRFGLQLLAEAGVPEILRSLKE